MTLVERVRPVAAAPRWEILVLAITLALGVLIGVALNSFLLGFLAVAIMAGIARLLLHLMMTDSSDRRKRHRHSTARS
jgi:uncharacterized membrane protein YczE